MLLGCCCLDIKNSEIFKIHIVLQAFLDMCTDIIESQEQQAAESRSSISLDEDSSHFDSHSDSSQLLSDGGRKRCC